MIYLHILKHEIPNFLNLRKKKRINKKKEGKGKLYKELKSS